MAHNRKANIVSPNFTNRDFVLVRRAIDKGHKLSSRWLGPRKIARVINNLVYEVSKLEGSNPEHVHASRLLLYREGLAGEPSEKLVGSGGTSRYQVQGR